MDIVPTEAMGQQATAGKFVASKFCSWRRRSTTFGEMPGEDLALHLAKGFNNGFYAVVGTERAMD